MFLIYIVNAAAAKLLQSCLTLCDPMDSMETPGSSVHRILQARILEWVAISFRDQTCISSVSFPAGRFFTAEPLGKSVYTHTHTHTHTHICIYIYIYTHTHKHIIYIYIHTHTYIYN